MCEQLTALWKNKGEAAGHASQLRMLCTRVYYQQAGLTAVSRSAAVFQREQHTEYFSAHEIDWCQHHQQRYQRYTVLGVPHESNYGPLLF